jgi:bilirubin oxidase
VLVFPGETTRIRARFDLPGRYVYHCHIIDHEDNEMMRPFDVLPRPGSSAPSQATFPKRSAARGLPRV